MTNEKIKEMVAKTFNEIADALESNDFSKKYKIGLAIDGSEHGQENIDEAIKLAKDKGIELVLIDGEDAHKKMEDMLDNKEIDGAVTMHYPFPIGVSTVGKIVTPGKGKAMYLATTTGTSDTERISAMFRNAIYGIIVAKTEGIENPTVGIANIDGARQCEKALNKLKENGYDINFATSNRADGGVVMRGNDLLGGTADVMVMDSLTGNLMTKIFSSYTTGGSYESLGWGYGPGVGEDFDKIIMIISRASGAPVIANAAEYAVNLVKNKMFSVARKEFSLVKAAGYDAILKEINKPKESQAKEAKAVEMPDKEVVTAQIPGIEVMDIEDAVSKLWENKIYAESGMGCTGPIVLVSDKNIEKAKEILKENGYI